ncbi:hypothetical protein MRX96_039059 [Rhipicephalus microplus]
MAAAGLRWLVCAAPLTSAPRPRLPLVEEANVSGGANGTGAHWTDLGTLRWSSFPVHNLARLLQHSNLRERCLYTLSVRAQFAAPAEPTTAAAARACEQAWQTLLSPCQSSAHEWVRFGLLSGWPLWALLPGSPSLFL